MKKRLLLSVLISIIYLAVDAQCNFPAPPGNSCATAPIICPIDGYCSSLGGANSTDQPSTFCGSIQNNQWLAFIPSTTNLTIDIIIGNCPNFQSGTGIQAQVYSVCGVPWTPVSNCIYEGSVNSTEQLVMNNLTIGNTYYLMLDGFSGGICKYTLSVTSGSTQPSGATLSADAGEDVLFDCLTQEVTLDGSNSLFGANDSIAWLDENFEFLSDSISFTTTELGQYYFLIQEDGGTCIVIDEVEVISFNDTLPSPFLISSIDIFTDTIGQAVFLDAINSNAIDSSYLLSWTTGNGNIVAHSDSLLPLISSSGTYILEITHPETGCVIMNQVVVSIIDPPVNIFSPTINTLEVEITPTVTNDEVRVKYILEKSTPVSFQVYNVGGVLLQDFYFGKKQIGEHSEDLSLKDFSTGIYFIFVKTEEGSAVRKVVKM